MPLETGTYISDLNAANPLGSDPIAFVDDHLRLVKSTIKATFPNISGAVTKTHTAINNIPDNTTSSIANLQAQINTLSGTTSGLSIMPVGGIIMWSGSQASIPSGWFLCDGGNGTPDLRGRFVIGSGGSYAVASTGGSKDAVVVSHTHTATSAVTDPGHSHSVQYNYGGATSPGEPSSGETTDSMSQNTGTATTGISVTTTVASAGVSGTDKNLPPYYALCFIMKG